MVDQITYFNFDSHIGSVAFIKKTRSSYEDLGVVLLKHSSMMGTFPLPPPDIPLTVTQVNMILTDTSKSLDSYDPWVVPSPYEYEIYGDRIPLTLIEISYQEIQSTYVAASNTSDSMRHILGE